MRSIRNVAGALLLGTALVSVSACTAVTRTVSVDMSHVESLQNRSVIEATVRVPVPLTTPEDGGLAPGSLAWDIAWALKTSPAVHEAIHGNESQFYGIMQSGAALSPRMDLNASVGGTDSRGAVPFQGTASAGTTLNWSADLAQSHRTDRERYRSLASMKTVHERVELVANGIGETFIDVPHRRELADAALRWERGIESFKKTDVVPAVQAGNANAADIPQSDASIHQARTVRIKAEQDLADARDRYVRLTGHEHGPYVPFRPLLVGAKDAEVARGAGHPSVAVIEANVQAAVANAIAVDRERFGSIGVEVGPLGIAKAIAGADPISIGVAFLKAAVPLLDGGEREARLGRSVATVQVGLAQRDDTARTVDYAIKQAWNMHASAVRQRAEAEATLRNLKDVERHYREQYKLGYRSAADVIQAMDSAFAAEAKAISSRYAEQYASVRLYAAQGRLVETLGAATFVETKVDAQTSPWEGLVTERGLFRRTENAGAEGAK